MDITVYQIILDVILVLLILYLALFKSYFQEKGKNLATKEDVEEITSKVEKIRSDLHLQTESKLSLIDEKRNALIDYYTKCDHWMNTLLEGCPSDVDEDNDLGFRDIESQIVKVKADFYIAKSRLEIFIDDKRFPKLEISISKKALELHHLTTKLIIDLRHIYCRISKNKKDDLAGVKNYQSLLDEKMELVGSYFAKRSVIYKTLIPPLNELRQLVYDHIKTISEA